MAKKKSLNQTTKLSSMQMVVFALAFALLGGLISWAAFAQGNPHGSGGGGSSAATVTASPNPASANGTKVYLAGCGYSVSAGAVQAQIVHSAGYTDTAYISVVSPGCLDNSYILTKEAGTYTINLYQKSSTKKSSTNSLAASTTLTVQ